jgi:hypothetical protein
VLSHDGTNSPPVRRHWVPESLDASGDTLPSPESKQTEPQLTSSQSQEP